MASSGTDSSPLVAADDTIAPDVPCRRCGYDLRGLPRSARCPECGGPVAISARGPHLRYADPAWVGRLARGASILAAIRAELAMVALAAVTSFGVGAVVIGGIAVVAILAQFAVGSWMLTAREPAGDASPETARARFAVRFGIWGCTCCAAALLGTILLLLNIRDRRLLAVLGYLAPFAFVAMLLSWAAQVHYAGLLALRVRDRRVWGQLYWVRTAILICSAIFGFGFIAMRSDAQSLAVLSLLTVVASLGLLIRHLFSLGALARRFRANARISARIWRAADRTAAQR